MARDDVRGGDPHSRLNSYPNASSLGVGLVEGIAAVREERLGAAVHHERLSGHEAGEAGQQKDQRAGDLARGAPTRERDAVSRCDRIDVGDALIVESGNHPGRRDDVGSNAICPDSVL